MATYTLHFGVEPIGQAATPAIDGHEDPNVEHHFEVNGLEATVSGSWACWGPADQDAAGDNSLHVATVVGADDEREIADLAGRIGDQLVPRLDRGSRLLDYGVVSAATAWSEDQLVFLRYSRTLYGRQRTVRDSGRPAAHS